MIDLSPAERWNDLYRTVWDWLKNYQDRKETVSDFKETAKRLKIALTSEQLQHLEEIQEKEIECNVRLSDGTKIVTAYVDDELYCLTEDGHTVYECDLEIIDLENLIDALREILFS